MGPRSDTIEPNPRDRKNRYETCVQQLNLEDVVGNVQNKTAAIATAVEKRCNCLQRAVVMAFSYRGKT